MAGFPLFCRDVAEQKNLKGDKIFQALVDATQVNNDDDGGAVTTPGQQGATHSQTILGLVEGPPKKRMAAMGGAYNRDAKKGPTARGPRLRWLLLLLLLAVVLLQLPGTPNKGLDCTHGSGAFIQMHKYFLMAMVDDHYDNLEGR